MEVVSILVRVIPWIVKAVVASYIWVPFLGVAVCMPFIEMFPDNMIVAGIAVGVILCCFIAWPILFIQRIIRWITKKPDFSFYKLIKNAITGKGKELDPKAEKSLIASGPDGGYPVGKKKGRWVKLPDTESYHCFIVGGTGTGKSSTQVIPLLLCSKLPCFAVDIKGELAEKSKNARREYLIFNPASPDSCGYDPFEQVKKESCILDITTIANAIIPVSPGSKDDFWNLEAQNYLAGALLACWINSFDFVEAMRFIQKSSAAAIITGALAMENEDVEVFLGHFNGMAEDTLSGIQATVSSKIMVFASDPDLMRVLSRKRMSGRRMMSPSMLVDENPCDIYLQIPEARLEVYKHATQLIIGQFVKYMEKQPDGHEPKVNFILDEFFRLGKLATIQGAFATLRSKGVRLFAITQSLAQLEVIYEKAGARALADNFGVKVLLGATEPESQKYFSDLLGTYDKVMRSRSSNQQMTQIGGSSGVTLSEQEKRIIKPEELGRLGDQCILFTPNGWTRVDKQPYYKCKELLDIAAGKSGTQAALPGHAAR